MITEFERNHSQEQMRGRDEPAFEWYTANFGLFYAHVHNRKGDWTATLTGATNKPSFEKYATKEEAIKAVRENIAEIAASLIRQTQDTP